VVEQEDWCGDLPPRGWEAVQDDHHEEDGKHLHCRKVWCGDAIHHGGELLYQEDVVDLLHHWDFLGDISLDILVSTGIGQLPCLVRLGTLVRWIGVVWLGIGDDDCGTDSSLFITCQPALFTIPANK